MILGVIDTLIHATRKKTDRIINKICEISFLEAVIKNAINFPPAGKYYRRYNKLTSTRLDAGRCEIYRGG